MTTNKIFELRESIGFSLMTQEEYDPDLSNENYAKDIINFNERKILGLMDVGFIIPNSSEKVNPLDNVQSSNYYDDKINAFYTYMKQSMCVYSTKSRKNLISKSKIKFTESYYIYYNYLQNNKSNRIVDTYNKKMYIWRFGNFAIKDGYKTYFEKGYELTILNEKMQIEDRAYYLIF